VPWVTVTAWHPSPGPNHLSRTGRPHGRFLWERARLQNALLDRAQLQKAILVSARLQGTNLIGAQLQEANLGLAQLQGASLAGAQLQGARLAGARLDNAYADEATEWPVGFDARRAGVIGAPDNL
jgi:uncharacterized protein YjbI with pentapeptide repeats